MTHQRKDGSTKIEFTRPPTPPLDSRGYAVLNLNGTMEDVRRSWRRTVLSYRLWCFSTTDQRYQYGEPTKQSCMLPVSGHFLVYMHFNSDWICAVIDGPSGYLDGYITRSTGKRHQLKVRENAPRNCSLKQQQQAVPLLIENAQFLPWAGSYSCAEYCKLGYRALICAFVRMHHFVEEGIDDGSKKVPIAGQTIILHIPEAAKSDSLLNDIDSSFGEGAMLGKQRLAAARGWSKSCIEALREMVDVTPSNYGRAPGRDIRQSSNTGNKSSVAEIKDVIATIETYRLLHRPDPVRRQFLLKNMPIKLGERGPVDCVRTQIIDDLDLSPVSFMIEQFTYGCVSQKENIDSKGGRKVKHHQHANGNTQVGKSKFPEDSSPSPGTANVTRLSVKLERPESSKRHSACMPATGQQMTLPRSFSDDVTDARNDAPFLNVSVAVENTSQKLHRTQLVKAKQGFQTQGAGIYNLGFTCYMSAALQCLHTVPELKELLMSYQHSVSGAGIDVASHNLTLAARNTFASLDESVEPIRPEKFFQMLGKAYPLFAERQNNAYMQQDAQEFWSQLLSTFCKTLTSETSETPTIGMSELFRIDLLTRTRCTDTGEEDFNTDSGNIIRCPVLHDVRNIHQGIQHDLNGEIEKFSLSLGRNAIHTKTSKITKLPRYLTIQLPRMHWDKRSETNIKIFHKVDFPAELDMYNYCSDELKQELKAPRQTLGVAHKREFGLAVLAETNHANDEEDLLPQDQGNLMDIDGADLCKPEKELTAIYDLVAVLTHQGATTHSGHYVGWAKQERLWLQFDDHITSTHDEFEILNLSGGGGVEDHMAYMCLYKARLV